MRKSIINLYLETKFIMYQCWQKAKDKPLS